MCCAQRHYREWLRRPRCMALVAARDADDASSANVQHVSFGWVRDGGEGGGGGVRGRDEGEREGEEKGRQTE